MKLDPDWQKATIALASTTEIAANADRKASLGEADLAAKGKPYQDDPLFMYLWNKKHGQTEDFERQAGAVLRPEGGALRRLSRRARKLCHAE